MTYSIKIDHDNTLIRYKHSGRIGKEEIGAAWQEFLGMEEFTTLKYNLLSDYSDAIFKINAHDVELITNFLSQLKEMLENKKQAMIIRNPLDTAITMLFEARVYREIGFKVSIFYTEEAALRWLQE
jgi:hypothetical protein